MTEPIKKPAASDLSAEPCSNLAKPRLCYHDEGVGAWVPVDGICDASGIVNSEDKEDGEVVEVRFKRFDMTDADFDAIPED